LSTIAELKVPRGYRFTDAKGARTFLEQMKSPVPPDVAGILAPESGGWWVTFDFSNIGHLKDDSRDQIDPAAILKTVTARIERENRERLSQGLVAIAPMVWALEPTYDSNSHTLEWALRAEGRTGSLINHTIHLLGRRAILNANVRLYNNAAELAPLKDLVKGAAFKEGEGYTDFRIGDKIAPSTLGELVAAGSFWKENSDASATNSSAATLLWIGLALLVCGGVASLGFISKRHRKAKRVIANEVSDGEAPAASGNGSKPHAVQREAELALLSPKLKVGAPVSARGVAKPRVSGSGLKGQNDGRRRRVFNYHKFYTEMVMQVSPATRAESYDGHPDEVNGNGYNGSRRERVAPEPHLDQGAVVNGNSEMIANQKSLIEDQKRIIEEQTKLIEEKNRLITEKNQLLKRQSELMDHNIL